MGGVTTNNVKVQTKAATVEVVISRFVTIKSHKVPDCPYHRILKKIRDSQLIFPNLEFRNLSD